MSGKNKDKPNGFSFIGGNQSDNNLLKEAEMDLESTERLANIFKRLDRNGNGRIDIQDLTSALKGVGMSTQYAEVRYYHRFWKEKCICFLSKNFQFIIIIEIFERV